MKLRFILLLFLVITFQHNAQSLSKIESNTLPKIEPQNSYSGTYYDNISSSATGEQLRFELYNLINGHIEFRYTSTNIDVWDILMETDEDPNDDSKVILLYKGNSEDKAFNQGVVGLGIPDAWNREHVWSQSRGAFGTDPGAGTDVHHLKPSDNTVNSSRGNKDFDDGGVQHHEATDCYTDSDSWQPRTNVKGDVARMLFYMAIRYEGERGDPELHLVDYTANATGEPVIGKLSTLLQWHIDDPVDAFEENRNDVIFSYQQNRNPFIDYPEWVDAIWGAGSVNSPTIASVTRYPIVPNENQDLVVTAIVSDNNSINSVTLKYQVDENAEQSIQMSSSGGDTYTATISSSNYFDVSFLKYYVVAEDNEGNFDYGYVKELFTGLTPISHIRSVKADGRLNFLGVYAKVKGVATVGSQVFSNTSLDVVLQDETSGITIYKGGANSMSIVEGNEYIICGEIVSYNGKAELVPDDVNVDIIDDGARLLPKPLTLTIEQLLINPENYEGQLVTIYQVEKTINSSPWPAIDQNANIEITDDGGTSLLTLRVDKDTDLDDNLEPAWSKDVTGIFGQYDSYYPYTYGYQIQPRRYTDFSNSIAVQLKLFLEGSYDVGENKMFPTINNSVPLKSPYSEDPRKIISMPVDIIDWVLVQLRTTENGGVVSSHSALLHKDGRIVADDGTSSTIRITAEPTEYFIVVKHRNHLSVMSTTKISLSNN